MSIGHPQENNDKARDDAAAESVAVLRERLRASEAKAHALERQLSAREARLNSIFNAAVEGIITIDRLGRVVSANASVEAILGYGEAELAGRNIAMLMPAEHARRHDQYIQNYIDSGISKIIGSVREVEGLHKDGRAVALDLSLAEFTIDGEIFFTGIVRDISQRKLQEREHREHLEELAHVARLSLMGEMASGIAHEVNQPLTAIAAYTEVCLNLLGMPSFDPAKLRAILAKTHQQALRAGQIVHRMRDFVRSKTSGRATANINDLVRECIGLCAAEIRLQNIVFCLELTDGLPQVYVNVIQVEQVLMNVLKNAIEAMHDQARPRHLIVRTQASAEGIEIVIKDNGHGVSDAERGNVMTPFFTTKKNGMGMGLAISRSLIEAHHGSLRFNSKAGKGTTFYVTLPAKENVDGR